MLIFFCKQRLWGDSPHNCISKNGTGRNRDLLKSILKRFYTINFQLSCGRKVTFGYMKTLSKISLISGFLATALAFAGTPNFPFPQNKAYPYGNTFQAATTGKIFEKFVTWKKAWYTEAGTYYQKYAGGTADANQSMPSGTARIISPNAHSELSVSEGIAYGMLLMVYMSSTTADYQTEFDKLWKYWKCYGVGLNGNGCSSWSGQGMDWEIDNESNDISSGSASDADFDAAVALIMASKQWNNSTYLSEAKQLISWIQSNDMESDGRIRPGSNWNEAFNPSYFAIAAFKLFAAVTGNSFWETAVTVNAAHLRACQNSTTGLMPDWCDWSSHTPVQTSASVSGGYLGFYDDAARTPWRMAWGYAWYGTAKAKEANDAIINWLDSATYGYAGMILPGYSIDGSSDQDVFISSTYTGGLGLAMLSADNPKSYLENLYYTLINTEGKESLTASKGENYFAATLNLMTLLTLTGNLPNLYDLTGYTAFTPDTTLRLTPKSPEGTLAEKNSASISGLFHWGSYSDKFGVTKMYPDSGNSAVYLQADGSNIVAMETLLAPEPTYEGGVDLDYPFAGVASSFDEAESYYDLSDLAQIRIVYKSQGVMRFALLDQETLTQQQEGSEPGFYLQPTEDWKEVVIDAAAVDAYGKFINLGFLSWANYENSREDVLKAVRGIKFDVKMSKGGFASFALREINLLDAEGNAVKSLRDRLPIETVRTPMSKMQISLQNGNIQYQLAENGSKLRIYDLNGTVLASKPVQGSGQVALRELVSEKGLYIVRLSNSTKSRIIKIQNN